MAKKLARPIKTEQDYKGAILVAKKIINQDGRESTEERRLQALIREMEKFDDQDGDEDFGATTEDNYDLPNRRWSDDTSEPE